MESWLPCFGLTASAHQAALGTAERMVVLKSGERPGSRPSAAEGGGAAAPALRPADRRSNSQHSCSCGTRRADFAFDLGSRSTTPIATDWHDGQTIHALARPPRARHSLLAMSAVGTKRSCRRAVTTSPL